MQLQLTLMTESKQCRKCLAFLPRSEFHRDRGRPDGLFLWCKSCAKKASADRWANVPKQRLIHAEADNRWRRKTVQRTRLIKTFVGCAFCNERAGVCLDFHHIDPKTKEITIGSDKRGVSWERVNEEILKCVVLCANCHRKVHAGMLAVNEAMAVTQDQIDSALT